MGQDNTYIRIDEIGVYRVAATQVMLDSVIAGFLEGHSPETIGQQYPALTLEQVYGSIAYYLAHRAEVDTYLDRQEGIWEKWRRRSEREPSAVVDRLRALSKSQAAPTP